MSRSVQLMIVGLALFIIGGVGLFSPIYVVLNQEQSSSLLEHDAQSVDFPLDIGLTEKVRVNVSISGDIKLSHTQVWPLVFYQYPTKLQIETVARYVNKSETSFVFGWENASGINLFVTGFMIRVFQLGNYSVTVNVTTTKMTNPAAIAGLGMIAVSSIPFMTLVIHSKRNPLLGILSD